jgi:chromosome segregation ATPase
VSEVPLDIRVIAERVAETVNRALMNLKSELSAEIEKVKARLAAVETEVAVLKSGHVKDVVKGVLELKTDELSASVGKAVAEAVERAVRAELERLSESARALNSSVAALAARVEGLGLQVKEYGERAQSLAASFEVTSKHFGELSKSVSALAEALGKVEGELSAVRGDLGKVMDELKFERDILNNVSGQVGEIYLVIRELEKRTIYLLPEEQKK